MSIINNLPNKYIKIKYTNIKLGRLNSRVNILNNNNNNNIILYWVIYTKKVRKNFNNIIYKYTGKNIKSIPYNYYYNNYRYLFNSSLKRKNVIYFYEKYIKYN